MPTKRLATEQAKQYSDDELVKLRRDFWSIGLPLNDFCTIKDKLPYQEMRRLLCISTHTCQSSDSAHLNYNAHMAEQNNHEQLDFIASTLAQLHTRLRSIKEEIESLMNGLHNSRPDK